DDPDGVRGRVLGRRAEQHVDRRAMAGDERPVLHRDVIAGAAALQQQMTVSRRNQRAARQYSVAVLRFFDLDLRHAVEPPGESGGEELWHVLDDDDAGARDWQRR